MDNISHSLEVNEGAQLHRVGPDDDTSQSMDSTQGMSEPPLNGLERMLEAVGS